MLALFKARPDPVGAGSPREATAAVGGTGFARVRGTSPLPQGARRLYKPELNSCSHRAAPSNLADKGPRPLKNVL
ncbi:hypothetical protein PAGU2196_27140 [Pseudomonas sp. PAGU 2196]|nr:hypothetical protein PAGU2196_27140 [Pseudomonas sp. PAGU 2196]